MSTLIISVWFDGIVFLTVAQFVQDKLYREVRDRKHKGTAPLLIRPTSVADRKTGEHFKEEIRRGLEEVNPRAAASHCTTQCNANEQPGTS